MNAASQMLVFALIVLILFSGLFSAVETAYSSASRIRLKAMENDGDSGAGRVLKVLDNYDRFLTSVLIGNNIVNILSATLGTILFTRWLGETKGPTVSTIVITLVVLLFGEITPKTFAKQSPERFAIRTLSFVRFIMVLFRPLVLVFQGWQYLTSKLFKVENKDPDISDELITMVDEAEKDGDLEEHESDLISAAIEFNDLDVKDILTPRVEVVAIPINASLKEVANVFSMNSFSRLPVYETSIDNIVGVIHEKDFYNMMYRDREHGMLRKIITPVIYTTENVKISTVLKQLQGAKAHLAVVLDEYGGTAGIVTMEDLLEAIVGDIEDEFDDEEEADVVSAADGSFSVDGSLDLEELEELIPLSLPDDRDFDTVGGLVLDCLGRFPEEGEHPVVKYGGYAFRVMQMEEKRIARIKIRKLPEKQPGENNAQKERK